MTLLRLVPSLFAFGCVVVFAREARGECPAADLRDGSRRALLATEELRSLRIAYAAERSAIFRAVRSSSSKDDPELDRALHVGATYALSASALDLCDGAERVTTGALVQGGVLAAETERWEGSVFVGERRVFTQTAAPDAARPNLTYRGLVVAGTARYREWVELTAGILTPERLDTLPREAVAPPDAPEALTRGFLVSSVPGSHVSHAIVLSDGTRPLVTTYLDANDVRPFRVPIALSGSVGWIDPTRQGFAGAGVALVLPPLRVGVDGSAETGPVRVRHGRASVLLGGTHHASRGGAYLSGGLRFALSRYVGRSIQGTAPSGAAPGFEVGMFAGAGVPWIAMGLDARVAKSTPESLAVLPAAYGNGEGSIRALVRLTPHVHALPRTFRGPFALGAGDQS